MEALLLAPVLPPGVNLASHLTILSLRFSGQRELKPILLPSQIVSIKWSEAYGP